MFSQKNVIDFAMWWYGPASDSCFKGQANVTVEQGFEYWNKNVYAAETSAQADNKLKAEIAAFAREIESVVISGRKSYSHSRIVEKLRQLSAV